jgi:quinolinate synthase
VHTWFEPEHIAAARVRYPGCRVVVHPECRREVVVAADGAGSTSYLVAQVRDTAPGATLVIGTEINLVTRLQAEHPDRTIVPLTRSLCPNMYRISLGHLARTLSLLADGSPVAEEQRITVPADVTAGARTALERMLAIR